jgi:hypothetical protein
VRLQRTPRVQRPMLHAEASSAAEVGLRVRDSQALSPDWRLGHPQTDPLRLATRQSSQERLATIQLADRAVIHRT